MKLADFQYHVPDELIAQVPARPRDSSRLMCVQRATGEISHHVFRDLPDLLDERFTLVVNNSRVIRAHLSAVDHAGQPHDVYLLRELGPDRWSCVGDGHTECASGTTFRFAHSALRATIERLHEDGTFDLRFGGVPDLAAELDCIGSVPLPPYVRDRSGEDQYQTVYARVDGSVAAPTAGLHFTPSVLDRLAARGVRREEVTLHVGYGTFAAVRAEDLAQHRMPAETYVLPADVADRLNRDRQSGRWLLAVGTTVTRTLETCADERGLLHPGSGDTSLFIQPPYRFRAVDALLTNFHMPGLTPIMLVAAFAGYELTMRAYEVAVRERYRFYSFGDSMLVL